MAEASKTVVMDVGMSDLLTVIRDYEKYPQFLAGCHTSKVLAREGGKTRVQYGIEIMSKDVTYTLDLIESGTGEGEAGLQWSLVDSNMMKTNSGSWKLKKIDKSKTEATYTINLEFKIAVPGFILNSLVKSSLPSMLKSFEDRTKETARG